MAWTKKTLRERRIEAGQTREGGGMGQEADGISAVSRAGGRWLLVGLGLFLTLLNVPKPITVDDSVYHLFATHIAEHPLDPYGFRAWGVQEANTILAPPVFLYWWALAVRLFGQHPVLWKLWLLPFNLLLVFMLHALGRRYARGMEMPFVFLVTLSAAVLPCVNLMLDIPALALSLLAIVLFLRASSANSLLGAAAAGLVAGIATQTKYTAFVAPGVMLLHSLLFGRRRLALLAASLAAAMFVGWELLIAWRYGESHFWLGCMQYRAPPSAKVRLVQPLFGYLGSTMAAGLPLALAALGRPARLVWTVAALVALVFALVAFPFDAINIPIGSGLSGALFGIVGASLLAALAVIGWCLLRRPLAPEGSPAAKWYVSADGFLVLWLLLEIAGYFALSPYPATRRVLGVAVLGTLLACRLAARTCADRARLIWGVAGLNFLLGLLLFAVDFVWYYGPEVMARELAGECHRQGPGGKVWYFGNGTFEFYAEALGMRRVVVPDAPVAHGDWVLVVGGFESSYAKHPIASRCVFQGVREWRSILPVRSQYQFGNVALVRQEKPLLRVTLYRVP
jgi:hypothetical protein